jgi:hypothetical protein
MSVRDSYVVVYMTLEMPRFTSTRITPRTENVRLVAGLSGFLADNVPRELNHRWSTYSSLTIHSSSAYVCKLFRQNHSG